MKHFFDAVLKNRLWVLAAFVIGCVGGAMALVSLPIDAVPDITNVQVMINTKTGGLDPNQIEKAVTYEIETEMVGLPGLEDVRSLSKFGLSQVILVFKDGTDLYFAREQVAQRLQNLRDHLPDGVSPELAPITTGLGEVVMYTVEAKVGSELSKWPEARRLLYLRTLQDYVIRPELKKVAGVADIDSSGGYRREIHINADIDSMERFGVSFEELNKRLQTVGDSYGGGYIQRAGEQIIVRTTSDAADMKTLGLIPIKIDVRGKPVFVKDLANVREDHTQRLGAATHNGQETVLGTALMYIGANSRSVALDVVEKLKTLESNGLPKDVETRVVYSRSYLVDKTIQTVFTSLLEGAGLVVLVLLLLLGNLRGAIIVSIAIPVSMLFSVAGMKFFGLSANLMSLGAIDFGLLVDGSIVMIENLMRRYAENGQPTSLSIQERLRLVRESAVEVARPVMLGLFIIMIVYVPILALTGIEGKMFHPMAITVLMALGASLLVAVFLMPVLGYLVLNPRAVHESKSSARVLRWIEYAYRPVLRLGIQYRKSVVLVTLIFGVLSAVLCLRMGSDFIPQLDEGDIVAGLVRDTSIAIDKSIADQKKAEDIIRSFGEVELVFSRLGTPESATDPMGVNFADTFIILKKDRSQWPLVRSPDGTHRRRAKDEVYQAIADRIREELPGHEVSPTQPIEMRFNEILEGSRADVSLRIYGPDLEVLMEAIEKAEEIVKTVPGVHEAEMDSLTALRKSPMMTVSLNYDALARYGVTLSEANSALKMAMGGIQVGNFYESERRFPIVLHLDEKLREIRSEIDRIPIALPDSGTIPLKSVAKVTEERHVTTIARSFGKRYGALSIFLKDRDVESFVKEARGKIESEVKLGPEYRFEWGGQFKNLEKARLKLLIIVPVTLLLILALLLQNFKSVRLSLLVFSSIPFAMTGGVISLYLREMSLSISAGIGFIALLGIAILNSMVLVDFINRLRAGGSSIRNAVMEGAMVRLRPIMTTALVASLGFLPMAFSQGMGAEVQRPLATVVIGGLISSTLLTLVLLPTLYIWIEERRNRGGSFQTGS